MPVFATASVVADVVMSSPGRIQLAIQRASPLMSTRTMKDRMRPCFHTGRRDRALTGLSQSRTYWHSPLHAGPRSKATVLQRRSRLVGMTSSETMPGGVRPRPVVDRLPRYAAGKPPVTVDGLASYKLSSNENPLPPIPAVAQAIAAQTDFNRYPDPL